MAKVILGVEDTEYGTAAGAGKKQQPLLDVDTENIHVRVCRCTGQRTSPYGAVQRLTSLPAPVWSTAGRDTAA